MAPLRRGPPRPRRHALLRGRGLLRGRALLLGVALSLLASALPLRAQRVVLTGHRGMALQERLSAVLEGPYTLIASDTVLQRDTLHGPLLILDATVAISTVVDGDVVAVGSNVFLRPSARVHGDVVSLAGGLYRSQLAEVTGATEDRPLARYRVERRDGTIAIEGLSSGRSVVFFEGPLGFAIPTYDRVDGLALGWGAGVRDPAGGRLQPALFALGRYYSARGDFGGTVEGRIGAPDARFTVGLERATFTNDAWLETDGANSIAFLLKQHDYRDYYDARRVYASAQRAWSTGQTQWTVRAEVQREEDRSLGAHDPWTISSQDSVTPNPAIDDGVVASALLDGTLAWKGRSAVIGAAGRVELAGHAAGGDFAFGRYQLHADWAVNTFRRQTLRIRLWLRGPLPGTDSLPLQRWTFVGGSHTLHTFPRAAFRGDRLVFTKTMYRFPLPQRWRVPFLGVPDLEILDYLGMAWSDDRRPAFEQNVGARLQFFTLYLRVLADPSDLGDADFDIGLKWPFGRHYPWERSGGSTF